MSSSCIDLEKHFFQVEVPYAPWGTQAVVFDVYLNAEEVFAIKKDLAFAKMALVAQLEALKRDETHQTWPRDELHRLFEEDIEQKNHLVEKLRIFLKEKKLRLRSTLQDLQGHQLSEEILASDNYVPHFFEFLVALGEALVDWSWTVQNGLKKKSPSS